MEATYARTTDRTVRAHRQPSPTLRWAIPLVALPLITVVCLLALQQRSRCPGQKTPSAPCTAANGATRPDIGGALGQRADSPAGSPGTPAPFEAGNCGPGHHTHFRGLIAASSPPQSTTEDACNRARQAIVGPNGPARLDGQAVQRSIAAGVAFAAATELLPGDDGPALMGVPSSPPPQADALVLPEEPLSRPLEPGQQWRFKTSDAAVPVPEPQEAIVPPSDEKPSWPLDTRTQLRFLPAGSLPGQPALRLVPQPNASAPPSAPNPVAPHQIMTVPEQQPKQPGAETPPPASSSQGLLGAFEGGLRAPFAVQPESTPLEPSVHWEDRSEQLEQLARQADRHTRHGFDLADRGALFAARAEFTKALRLIAQGLDAEYRTSSHSRALAAGLAAIEEAADFVPDDFRLETNMNLSSIIGSHVTPVLKNTNKEELGPMACMQCYLSFAQEQLAAAAKQEIAGSMALCALGKVYATLATQRNPVARAAEPRAVTFYQAALLVYPGNLMAANELGVLYVRYGDYRAARAALEHSLRIHQHPAGWRNLSVVYRQLGQVELAEQAARQAEFLARVQFARQASRMPSSGALVQWVDPATFAQTARDLPAASPPVPAQPATTTQGGARAQGQPALPAVRTGRPALPAPLSGLLGPSVARRTGEPAASSSPSPQ